ncbi:glycosyltransferase family 4 protein [Methyloterricola oryzae]|uniref:glycosyltransferase family 4 protein n=1 Tax=Methyloterricola oryzae TaxID=1495050 RepID=UPI0011AF1C3C|nr:glycosyltransferase [Methyloterricola oryzae]
MRILVLGDVPPFVIGGAEMQAWRLARQWVELGHRVDIAGHRIPNATHEGVNLFRLSVFRQGGRSLRGASYFLSVAAFLLRRRHQYDLIYCRFLGEAALSVAFLKHVALVGLPLIAVPASAGSEDKADFALLRSLPATDKLVLLLNQQCECVNYIAPGIEQNLRKIGVQPKRTAYIPNGVSLSSRRAQGPKGKVGRLVFVGRLVYPKGLELLFPCLCRLKQKGFTFKLTLVGDGDMRPHLEHLASTLNLENDVEFLGEQSHEAVANELEKAELFILPSRFEGLSNAALEALSYGLPCLLSRCGGLDTFLTKGMGWVFDSANPEEVEAALAEALSITPDRWRAMSQACRTLVETQFSLESVAQQYIELFESL